MIKTRVGWTVMVQHISLPIADLDDASSNAGRSKRCPEYSKTSRQFPRPTQPPIQWVAL